ncbi:hypothetical protein FOA52_002546 [Chlamydomonas sp. UWO 241]|nr:hypothetical protein FOA52_002546 [Chlamydomonas sp. UWO 241]
MAFLGQLEALCQGLTALDRLRGSAAYGAFLRRWNLSVYFSLLYQDIAGRLEDAAGSASTAGGLAPLTTPGQDGVRLPLSASLLDCLARACSPATFLPPLADRTLKLALQMVARYRAWMRAALAARAAGPPPAPPRPTSPAHGGGDDGGLGASSGGGYGGSGADPRAPPVPSWVASVPTEDLAVLQQDVLRVADHVSSALHAAVVELLSSKGLGNDAVAAAGASLESAASGLRDTADAFTVVMAAELGERCVAVVRQLKGITATYRMTTKGPPTRHSHYVTGVLTPLRTVLESERLRGAAPGGGLALAAAVADAVSVSYTALAEELLTTVRKTEESLKRLKKKEAADGAGGGEAAMSDSDKIGLQLQLDVAEYGAQLASLGLAPDAMPTFQRLQEAVNAKAPKASRLKPGCWRDPGPFALEASAVLFSAHLWSHIWVRLDRPSKATARLTCRQLCQLCDGEISELHSHRSDAAAAGELGCLLPRWARITKLSVPERMAQAACSNAPNGLKKLTLTHTACSSVVSLAALSACSILQHLDINETAVSDLTPIRALTNLQHLYIHQTPVSDLTPLQALNNLLSLDMENCLVTGLEPLSAAQAQQIASLVDVVSLLVSRVPGAPMQMPHAEPARARAGHAAHSAAPRAAPAAEAAQPARPAAAAAPVASAGGAATERPASGATRAASARGPSRRGGLPARVGDTSLRRSFVLSIPVARGANWFLAGGGRRMDEEEATAAAAERIAAAAEDGTSLPVRLATDVVRFLYGGTGRREPADGGVVSASLLNAKPAVGGIGVEPRGGGVLRVLFTVASDAVADTDVRWRHELRRCVDSTAVFDVLSDREEAQHQALWPAFLAAKVAGKRAQFHRARLVVDGERVPAPAC